MAVACVYGLQSAWLISWVSVFASLSANIAGGVESMAQFGRWFFPATTTASSFYCKYNDRALQAYSALMHFTGALASIPASYFTQHWGRKGYGPGVYNFE